MALDDKTTKVVLDYAYSHLPNEDWYNANFFPFIKDKALRDRLIIEFSNARVLYKIFEGIQAKGELLLAQIKTQVVMYVSIQEAVINYVLFELNKDEDEVKNLLYQDRDIKISIPKDKLEKLTKALVHDGKEILTVYKGKQLVDKTKIRFDQKVTACWNMGLISEDLKEDLIKLYEYRNTVHIEAELKKGLVYDLEMGKKAYRRVEGLSIILTQNLSVKH